MIWDKPNFWIALGVIVFIAYYIRFYSWIYNLYFRFKLNFFRKL